MSNLGCLDRSQRRLPVKAKASDEGRPALVAIVGGSGSGKSWLCEKLARAFAPDAARLCLDDFYRDRSHLSLVRRARLNFDRPQTIDWRSLARVLKSLLAGRAARAPCYDFKTHSRTHKQNIIRPRPILLLEGLWLLRRPEIRRLLSFSIFLECPSATRLRRRIARDRLTRGRTRSSIEAQFRKTVQPMHARYVAPQARQADLVLKGNCSTQQVGALVKRLRAL